MNGLEYYILDVFAETKYAGNQLAVFRNAGELPAAEMQRIVREINYSETTFIRADTPAADGGYGVRIFTPLEEVPFAGHPTLGTAHIIRSEILGGAAKSVTLDLRAGRIPVTFGEDGYAWMQQVQPTFGAVHTAEEVAPVLGLEAADIDGDYAVQEVSTGLPFFIVPLKSLAALQRAKVDRARYFAMIADTWAKGILIFCPQAHEPGNDLSCARVRGLLRRARGSGHRQRQWLPGRLFGQTSLLRHGGDRSAQRTGLRDGPAFAAAPARRGPTRGHLRRRRRPGHASGSRRVHLIAHLSTPQQRAAPRYISGRRSLAGQITPRAAAPLIP
jgi:trans-2,3-dihydro-3-hydroxyanthranilate isomerase